jgi:hypothetical protein
LSYKKIFYDINTIFEPKGHKGGRFNTVKVYLLNLQQRAVVEEGRCSGGFQVWRFHKDMFFLNKSYHPTYTLAGFDLTTLSTASRDDATKPRARKVRSIHCTVDPLLRQVAEFYAYFWVVMTESRTSFCPWSSQSRQFFGKIFSHSLIPVKT